MKNAAFNYETTGNGADTRKYYVVWIDRDGKRYAGSTPSSKFVAASICDSAHYLKPADNDRNLQSGLIREDKLYDWFHIDNPMSLMEDYKVRAKQRYITISNSIAEFNMRRKGDGFQVFKKGHEPICFESDSEGSAVSKATAYINEQLKLVSAS